MFDMLTLLNLYVSCVPILRLLILHSLQYAGKQRGLIALQVLTMDWGAGIIHENVLYSVIC